MAESSGMDAFAHLGSDIREALSDRGFSTPTEPQREAIPPLADGRNALVLAPTGTGKTETAMLPVFDAIVAARDAPGDPPREGISALYITPLRALNRDMMDRLEWWGDRLGVEVAVRHGDTTQYERSKQADDPPDVLITTPESLQAILTGSKMRVALEDVAHVVIDEVHELAAAKRGAQLTVGLERLRRVAGPFQRVGLSATVGDPEEVGRFLVGTGKRDPDRPGDRAFETVEVAAGTRTDVRVLDPAITDRDTTLAGELAVDETTASHVRTIREIVAENESTLIFVNTRQTAEALGSRFKTLAENEREAAERDGRYDAADPTEIELHHGSLSKEVRVDVEDRFKSGDLDGLVCTSSMELGIDVGRVDHVVQYGSPREVARLLQRVGRAGHRRDLVSEGTVVTQGGDDTLEAMAIARRAGEELVEPANIHHGSLDTVANQIVGLVMDEGEVHAREAYQTITNAYPFADLSEPEFQEVVRELDGNRLLWLDEETDTLEKSGGTWQYFYANLSMIPDESTYEVYDMSSRRGIGTLDEQFVVNFAGPGETFVQRGEMWRITEVDEEEERVNVTPIPDPTGEVPSWVGQEIPVPKPVAEEVGQIRGEAAAALAAGSTPTAVAADLAECYPTDEETVAAALKAVVDHVDAGHPVPTDERIVIEGSARTVAVNAAFGHEVNETLARLLAALVGQRAGSSVGMDVDPYRIEFEVPNGVSPGTFREVLETTDPDRLEAYLELAVKKSDALKFTLAQVAAKFGAVKRYKEGHGRFGGDRLLAALEDTPVYDEALREVFHADLAVPETADLLAALQPDDGGRDGPLDLSIARERTPLGTAGRSAGTEFLVPDNADADVIETVKERIRDDRVILFCLHCTDWKHTTKVRRVRDQPECPECGSTRVAALNPWDDETVAAVRAAEKDDEQERRTERAHRAASLVQTHGKRAVIALAARGVGPHNAARIINKLREDEDEFYRDVLRQEREYARTQSFWD
ncbi:DEAD/DEAH box helicase [Halorubrum ezzemoulense]|uniref:DEAD/DEAH box helicase n=1 Tax=Halorubrum ezzemoulense TaxID=337243 RepID=UPI00232B2917|nr:DEAD/DEAH box helicase [Halorubrum ezzemoulense]MDB9249266.1 DEAD/DEAH box helicase [Halorubrum ezzemoulense]MDB9259578.1 DEAD/DEAH box helicase [Halorubrum ezzemoulense]MDB9263044.1 DEAD/DEAH box helicase [Halorubrum ezzemoulense]MDB9266526.1 DEAD/DEAH box helicase [Halorubrum ezzemoulense]MDB9269939.1 DEAD/DEAH box helicase [Halorubrum ezzemoulense]